MEMEIFRSRSRSRISLIGNARAACVLREKLIAHLISIARRQLTNAAAHTCSRVQIYWSISLMPDETSSLASVNSLRLIYMKILSTRAPFAYFLDRPLHQTHSARKLKSPRSHLPSLPLRLSASPASEGVFRLNRLTTILGSALSSRLITSSNLSGTIKSRIANSWLAPLA